MQSIRSKLDGVSDNESVMPDDSLNIGSVFDKSAMNATRI